MILLLIPLQLSAYVQKGGVLSYDNTVRQWNNIFNNRKVTEFFKTIWLHQNLS